MWRLAASLVVLGLAACTTLPPPTASPAPSPTTSHVPSATDDPIRSPPMTPDASGLPAEILGMPVLTVEAASRLLLEGDLDGRAVAVGGYWAQSIIDCPYSPHEPVIAGDCWFVAFTDEPLDGVHPYQTEQGPGVIEPMIVTETANQDLLWPPDGADPMILIGHAGDPRLWQCAPDWREHCGLRFVVDRVAWADGQATPGVGASSEAVITRYRVTAAEATHIDPRLAGVASAGDVWVERVLGDLGADGAGDLSVRAIDAASGEILANLPVAATDYTPARLTIDSRRLRGTPSNNRDWRYAVESPTGAVLAMGRLNGLTPPLPLTPGDVVLHAWTVDLRDGSPIGHPCTLDVSLDPEADRYFRATFAQSQCSWTEADG